MSSIQACGGFRTLTLAALAIPLSFFSAAFSAPSADSGAAEQLVVFGKVVCEDGAPPPFGAILELDCGNGFVKTGEVGLSGHFSFSSSRNALSGRDGGNSDSQSGSLWALAIKKREQPPPFEMRFCFLRVRLSGYHSSVVRIAADPGAQKEDVGNIVLSPNLRAKGTVVPVTTLQAPARARKLLLRAQAAMQRHSLDKAYEALKSALARYPEYAEAWYQIGLVHQHRRLYSDSEKAFLKAIELDPAFLPAYIGLATLAWRQQDWRQMLAWSERCLQKSPLAFPDPYFLNAMALYGMNRLDAAEASARKGQQLDTGNSYSKFHLLLAEILFSKKDIEGSLKEMQSYLRSAPPPADASQVRAVMEKRLLAETNH